MPERFVKARARTLVGQQKIMSGDWLVNELAEAFDVSRQAMLYRLVNLQLLDDLAIAGG